MRKFFKLLVFSIIAIFTFNNVILALSISDAQKEYLFGNYQEAIRIAKNIRSSDRSLYFLGLSYIKIGNYQQARGYLRKLLKYYPNSKLYLQGKVKLADTYFLEKDYDSARDIYNDLRERHSSFSATPLVLLRLAQIASRQGQWKEKNSYLSVIKSKYPLSSEMRFVEVLEGYGDFFTIQVGAFTDKKNALSLKNELSSKYKIYIVEDNRVYKVRVGRYKDRYDVEKIAKKLDQEGYPTRIYP
tara:strand:+ start:309 stop:1037 length:729 start_codon:yes stop_codon:yes gene_type:complete